ncbi:hypothetical protein [Streptomyces sp. NPDC057702]|uniref:hypothetical protein n=1 Tax=Streptomyces sp. NPDC057702 TaxID=3346221 RepID=UPI003681439C
MTTTPAPATKPLTGTDEGFATFYGIALAPVGEDGERLLALGHPTTRRLLAALTAYHRDYGHCLLPGDELTHLLSHGIRQTWAIATDTTSPRYAWVIQDATPEHPGAQPVTWIDHEALDYRTIAIPEQCPQCGRTSRSTTYHWATDHRGGPHHTCRVCECCWPATPTHQHLLASPEAPGIS